MAPRAPEYLFFGSAKFTMVGCRWVVTVPFDELVKLVVATKKVTADEVTVQMACIALVEKNSREDCNVLLACVPGVRCMLVEAGEMTVIPWGVCVAEKDVNAKDVYGLRFMWVDNRVRSDIMVLANKRIPQHGHLKVNIAATFLLKCIKAAYDNDTDKEQSSVAKDCLSELKLLSAKLEIEPPAPRLKMGGSAAQQLRLQRQRPAEPAVEAAGPRPAVRAKLELAKEKSQSTDDTEPPAKKIKAQKR